MTRPYYKMIEFSLGWMHKYPDLFATSYREFFEDHKDMEISALASKGTLSLIAKTPGS